MSHFGYSPEFDNRDELYLCPQTDCQSSLVYPVEWHEAGDQHWMMLCRCPNCQWHGTGIHSEEKVQAFAECLDAAEEDIRDDLQTLSQLNLEAEIDRFVTALEADLILPEDIGRIV